MNGSKRPLRRPMRFLNIIKFGLRTGAVYMLRYVDQSKKPANLAGFGFVSQALLRRS